MLDFYGLSATAFSESIDFNRSTISHLLSGRNKPSLEFVMKVLKQFPEVELYWLLNGTGNFPSTSTSEKFTPQTTSTTQPSQMEDKLPVTEKKPLPSKSNSEIERIIIFYKDGSFKSYE
ncbi:MAG: helix-turn-helix transcriptional regulator [Bacteroidota bacterium]